MTQPIIGLVGPSAAGKSTLILEMVRLFPSKIGIVKSLTTRPRRGSEDDLFYDFITVEEMRSREQQGRLIQISEYAGNLYAHDRGEVDALLVRRWGICALVEQGVRNLRQAGYEVAIVNVYAVDGGAARDVARANADRERALHPLEPSFVIENSFAEGGLSRSSEALAAFLLERMQGSLKED